MSVIQVKKKMTCSNSRSLQVAEDKRAGSAFVYNAQFLSTEELASPTSLLERLKTLIWQPLEQSPPY